MHVFVCVSVSVHYQRRRRIDDVGILSKLSTITCHLSTVDIFSKSNQKFSYIYYTYIYSISLNVFSNIPLIFICPTAATVLSAILWPHLVRQVCSVSYWIFLLWHFEYCLCFLCTLLSLLLMYRQIEPINWWLWYIGQWARWQHSYEHWNG